MFSAVFIFLRRALVCPIPGVSSLGIEVFMGDLPLSPGISNKVARYIYVFQEDCQAITTILTYIFRPANA